MSSWAQVAAKVANQPVQDNRPKAIEGAIQVVATPIHPLAKLVEHSKPIPNRKCFDCKDEFISQHCCCTDENCGGTFHELKHWKKGAYCFDCDLNVPADDCSRTGTIVLHCCGGCELGCDGHKSEPNLGEWHFC